MDSDEHSAACAATTNESRKRTQRIQRGKAISLRSLCSFAANSLPRKQRSTRLYYGFNGRDGTQAAQRWLKFDGALKRKIIPCRALILSGAFASFLKIKTGSIGQKMAQRPGEFSIGSSECVLMSLTRTTLQRRNLQRTNRRRRNWPTCPSFLGPQLHVRRSLHFRLGQDFAIEGCRHKWPSRMTR